MTNKIKEQKKYLTYVRKILSIILVLGLATGSAKAKETKYQGESNQTYINVLNETEEYLKKHRIETERLKCGTLYVKSYIKGKIKNIIIYSNDEFREHIKDKVPTFEDVYKVIEKNEKITEEFKNKIKNYINKIKEQTPNVDLSVFYYNLEKLEIDKVTKEELKMVGENIVARFDARNHKIIYINEIKEKTFEHELSHLFTECYIYIDENTLIHKTMSVAIPQIEEDKITIKFCLSAALEGITDLFTAKNNKENYKIGAYQDFAKQIIEFLEITEDSILDIQENGIIYLLDKLYERGIENSFEITNNMDLEFTKLIKKPQKLV